MRLVLTILLLLSFAMPSYGQDGSNLFNDTYVHEIKVQIDNPDFWNALLTNYNLFNRNGDHIYTPANVSVDGIIIKSVGFRIKGFLSAVAEQGKKKPFRIDFDEFVSSQQYDGIRKLSLNNAFDDPSYMRDVLAYNIMRTAGVPASRTAYTRLYINDAYWGLYIMAEQIDKTFLSHHFKNDNGNLFKSTINFDLRYQGDDPKKYKNWLELKTNEAKDDWTGLAKFVKYLNKEGISDGTYRKDFFEMFDTERYLKVLAIDIILLNWDSYYDNGRNFYLYEDIKENKFHWIPWDYNLSFSMLRVDILAQNTTVVNDPKPLIRNLLKEPIMQEALMATYRSILESNFTEERLFPIIDQTKALIYEDLHADKNKSVSMDLFARSLEHNTQSTVKDTLVDSFDMARTYLYADQNQIPDSVLQLGVMLVDTTFYNMITFDTVDATPMKIIYARCTKYYTYEINLRGLKSFIQQRIEEVNHEIDIVTGLPSDVLKNDLVVYPNPVHRYFDLSGKSTERIFDVSIYDLTGRIILQFKNNKHLEVESLPPGVYCIEVINDKVRSSARFIKSLD
jgi:hypothetical protein